MEISNHNRLKSIPLHRMAVVRPFARFLADVGAPVERGFRRAGLPYYAIEDANNYVPSYRFYGFLVDMARTQGIDNLGFHVGHQFGADSVDPRQTELLRQSSTLYRGLLDASELVNRTITNCQVGILQPPGCRYAYFFHSPSCDADNPAIRQIGWFGVSVLVGMVRVFTGPQWQPSEIGLMTSQAPCLHIQEQYPQTRIQLSQRFSYIALEKRLLSLPPIVSEGIPVPSSPPNYLSDDLANSVEKVLVSYMEASDLSLELAADLCSMSKRTLQRRLAEDDTSYTEVLDRARFRVARRMLEEQGLSVTGVSHRLGYSDVAHFSRAFRRIAGITPRAYRRQNTG